MTPMIANLITRGIVKAQDGVRLTCSIFRGQPVQPNVLNAIGGGVSVVDAAGLDVFLVSLNGDATTRIAIAARNPNAPDVVDGANQLFSPDGQGVLISMSNDDGLNISVTGDVNFTVSGDAKINGKRIAVEGDSTTDGAKIV